MNVLRWIVSKIAAACILMTFACYAIITVLIGMVLGFVAVFYLLGIAIIALLSRLIPE